MKISKVWVCGPPLMNQTFDKVLTKIAKEYNLDPLVDIDIM
jgi:hypothetical protein